MRQKLLLPIIAIIWMISSVNSAEVTCEWNGEVCKILSATPVIAPNETITIAGRATNYINSASSYIVFNSTILRYVPTNFFKFFPYLNSFAMINTFTTNLVTDAFTNCQYLNTLGIYYVNIQNVPEGFAQSCSNVRILWLVNAGIQTIDVNAFKGMTKLEFLTMPDNKIACLPPDLFQNIPLISEINIENSKILAVDSGLFRNLPRLHIINLSRNLLSYLPLFDFTGSAALNGNLAFFLSTNPINAIHPSFCNIFDTRPTNVVDMFDIPNFNCLPRTAQTATLLKSNCRTTMASYLQVCYGNWTTAMSYPVPCASSSCALFLWKQFLNYLKTVTYQ
ncbi:phospholipase A2 inhibitor beta-like [Chironomus tepperi]|uniref:phospholipase A2 inhibitor beta-like n=1 Tax=Chironomus tepperi TaxID=113505 RepID=UPI00391FA73B